MVRVANRTLGISLRKNEFNFLSYILVLCQHIIVHRDSEIAPTDGLLMVRGNSDSRPFQAHQLSLD